MKIFNSITILILNVLILHSFLFVHCATQNIGSRNVNSNDALLRLNHELQEIKKLLTELVQIQQDMQRITKESLEVAKAVATSGDIIFENEDQFVIVQTRDVLKPTTYAFRGFFIIVYRLLKCIMYTLFAFIVLLSYFYAATTVIIQFSMYFGAPAIVIMVLKVVLGVSPLQLLIQMVMAVMGSMYSRNNPATAVATVDLMYRIYHL